MDEAQTIDAVLARHGKGPSQLVPVLLSLQETFGYLPEEGMKRAGKYLGVTLGQIYAVASFYKRFQLTPVGRRRVTVCRGTACHIRGAPQIVAEVEKSIGVKEGETSGDMEYTLETVACIGCCALAPVLKVNEAVHGGLTPRKARDIFDGLPRGAGNA